MGITQFLQLDQHLWEERRKKVILATNMNTSPYQQEPHFFPNQQYHGLMMGGGGGGPHCTSSYQQEEPHMSGEGERMLMMKRNNRTRGGEGGGVRLSTDPQSVAARERRHRISDRFKILQSLVPGGSKMDTVSMLEEAIHYVKFLKTQIWLHQALMVTNVDQEQINPTPLPPQSPFSLSSSSSMTTPSQMPIIPSFQASSLDNSYDHGLVATSYSPPSFPSSSADLQQQQSFGSYSSLPPLPNQDFSWSFQLEDELLFSQPSNVNYYMP